jgi:hypothetical protein
LRRLIEVALFVPKNAIKVVNTVFEFINLSAVWTPFPIELKKRGWIGDFLSLEARLCEAPA